MKNELSITLVSAGCTISGDMIVDHGISYFGLLDGGLISTQGLLHVGDGGLVKGNVQGDHVRIDGRVDGNVHARGTLEINGHVSGDIMYCGTIRLGPRAALNGTLKRVARMLTVEPEASESAKPELASAAPAAEAAAPERAESNVTEISRAKA
ncbi:polymer-forming cytoskeletal protein [Paraburkholderia sp. MMS20-SJTR3]|uniref:Polymer-forming cytoskeletal protein n=1 Tax=Paraburkholderia sejongensis TaxID=2886946 RepID=A0ABS8K6N6_9BURK|nr:polymer-forming cytoskeletal protein [Paraburkholderia sp. MMS20-SJTR3]MCC8397650.1 polymer-forming cytoskeletal protein [Paraburkholderia sp. MMS20-SJTR3]